MVFISGGRRSPALVLLLLLTTAASGQQAAPTLTVPSASTPAMTAFLRWHQSLLKKDFAAYKSVVFTIPEITESMQKQMFDQLVTSTPAVVKIGDQKTNPNGSVSFTAVGCIDNRRLVNVITVGNAGGTWRVASSGWGPPWNATVTMCPI